MVVGSVHLWKTGANACKHTILFAHAAVHRVCTFAQVFLQNIFHTVLHRKVLHNTQGLCKIKSLFKLQSGIDIGLNITDIILQTVGGIAELLLDTADGMQNGGMIFTEFLGNIGK